jgi:hypothetical protein
MTHPQVPGQLANAMEPDEGKEPQKVQKEVMLQLQENLYPFQKKIVFLFIGLSLLLTSFTFLCIISQPPRVKKLTCQFFSHFSYSWSIKKVSLLLNL